jgi:hypothetical protein
LQPKTRLTTAPIATRSSGHDGIEPTKQLLKEYLARAGLAVLASAFTRCEEHIFLGTSQGVVQILAAAAPPIVFRLSHKCWTLNIFRYVGERLRLKYLKIFPRCGCAVHPHAASKNKSMGRIFLEFVEKWFEHCNIIFANTLAISGGNILLLSAAGSNDGPILSD